MVDGGLLSASGQKIDTNRCPDTYLQVLDFNETSEGTNSMTDPVNRVAVLSEDQLVLLLDEASSRAAERVLANSTTQHGLWVSEVAEQDALTLAPSSDYQSAS